MFDIDSTRFYLLITVIWVALRVLRALFARGFDLRREIYVNLLFIFLCLLSYRVFEPFRFNLDSPLRPNFVPILNSLRMIQRANEVGYTPLTRFVRFMLIGNLLVFAPIGFLISILFRDLRSGGRMLLVGAGISLTIEAFQYLMAVRVFDIDDILLNSLGTWLGFVVFVLLNQIHPLKSIFDRIAQAQRPAAGWFYLATGMIMVLAFIGTIYQGWMAAADQGDRVLGEPEGRTLLEWLRWLLFRNEG